jgi:dTDP-4-amino-4,6-dideoxygalactose transaminase
MIYTTLSPNTEKDDVWLALSLLVRPWVRHRKGIVERVEKSLAENVRVKHVVATNSGRTALYALLKALDISEGDEVIVQGYTCVAVPGPVLWAGAKPIYVDCNDELTMDAADLARKIIPATKAIVVQHTFGMPAKMKEILALARARGVLVIEDCAHALGGTLDGAPLGSLGDAAFFSFGRDKCISSVFGGAIATNSDELADKIRAIVASYPQSSSLWVARQLLHPLVLAIAKSTYNVGGIGRIILGAARRLHLISRAVEPRELKGAQPSFAKHRFSPALATLALRQLRKVSRYSEHRRTCAALYAERLRSIPDVRLPVADAGHAYLRYTIFVDEPKRFLAKARAHGIELGDWYSNVLAPSGVVYKDVGYIPGSCPNAERLAARSLNLPTHIGITPEAIETILTHVFL